MTEPLVPFGRTPAAGGPPPGEPEPMERLVENIARLIDRLHPPGSADIPPGLFGATARLRRSLRDNHTSAASHAILALKEILNEVESLRERTTYLEAASAKAFTELNTTEHRLRELNGHIGQVWAVLAQATVLPDTARQAASDALADPDQRIATLRAALAAVPAEGDSLATQVRSLRERAAALRKDHGRSSEDDLHRRFESDLAELKQQHEAALAASRADADHARAELAEQLADARRELALIDAERAHLRASSTVAQERLTALEHRIDRDDSTSVTQQREKGEAHARLAGELAAVRTHAADLEQRLAMAEADLAEREADADGVAALHTRLSDTEQHRDAAESARDEALALLEQTRQERDRCARDLVNAQAQIEDLEHELAQSASDRHRAVSECDTLRERLQGAAQTANDAALAQAAAEANTLRERIADLEAERETEAASLATLREELTRVRSERERAGRDATALQTTLHDRLGDLFRVLRRFGQLATAVAACSSDTAELTAARQQLVEAITTVEADPHDEHVAIALRHAAALESILQTTLTDVAERLDTAVQDAVALTEAQAAQVAAQRDRDAARTHAATTEQALQTALARATEAEAAQQELAAELEQQSVRLDALDEELRTTQVQLTHARAAVDTAAATESALRSTGEEQVRAAEQAARHAHAATTAAEQQVARLQQQLTAIIDQIAAATDIDSNRNSDDPIETVVANALRAISERHDALDDERRAAVIQAERTATEVASLVSQVAELQSAQAAAASAQDTAETARRSAEHQLRQHADERDTARATADLRARELAEARNELAAASADLDSLRATTTDLEAQLRAAGEIDHERDRLREALATAERAASAADERVAGLLTAVKALGHTANDAADQVGVGLPVHSRHLTRTTARIERAENGSDLTVAIANARTVCERAAAQCESLSAALTNERQARRTVVDERDQIRAAHTQLSADVAALTVQLGEIDRLRSALSQAQAEVTQLHDAVIAAEATLADSTTDSERRVRAARAENEDLAARLALAQSEVNELQEALRRETQGGGNTAAAIRDTFEARIADLEAELAEAQGRADSLASGLDARDEELTRLRADLDRQRAGNGEVLSSQARVRSLSSKLSDTVAEVERLRSEREQDAERLTAVTELEQRIARLSAERHDAANALRTADEALAEQRTKANELARRLERSERDWKRRLAAADEALTAERERADLASATNAHLHGELAVRRTNRKPSSP